MTFVLLLMTALCEAQQSASPPQFLTMQELIELSDTAEPTGALRAKVDALLNTPFVGGTATSPKRPLAPQVGPVLRVAEWNIERGAEFDLIRMAFSDPDGLVRAVAERNAAVEEKHRAKPEEIADVRPQSEYLMASDVMILNEADLGMSRTDYRDVAKELAEALGMAYAFGVEFIEVDKIYLGIEELKVPEEKMNEQFRKDLAVDTGRYKGLHGSAVLSRYPIRSARNIRLKACHDWYGDEIKLSELEKGKRLASKNVFLERISREVRHGNRFALLVDIEVPESPTGLVTVVSVHLENKCRPTCRKEQMEELLAQLEGIKNPLVMGGDLNTTGTDGAPTSIGREIKKRVRNPNFWAGQAISWFSPIAFPNLIIGSANYVKNYQDPTALSVPVIAVNREARLFDKLEKFRFQDGGSFVFSGYKTRSANGQGGTLANSNERAEKGFTPTFEFDRDYKGLVGQFRLDWLLVKPSVFRGNHPLQFTPWYGRTLDHLNEAVPKQISDHHPITVDLPLTDKPPSSLFPSASTLQ